MFNNEDKLWIFIICGAISIFCFSIGIGKLTTSAIGWIFDGLGTGCFGFAIFWFEKYLNKRESDDG